MPTFPIRNILGFQADPASTAVSTCRGGGRRCDHRCMWSIWCWYKWVLSLLLGVRRKWLTGLWVCPPAPCSGRVLKQGRAAVCFGVGKLGSCSAGADVLGAKVEGNIWLCVQKEIYLNTVLHSFHNSSILSFLH